MGGRGQQLIDRATQLQQQLQQAEQEQTVAYAPVYYPGTTTASGAAGVTLSVGEERGGVDFQLQLVPTAKIEGRIPGAGRQSGPGNAIVARAGGSRGDAVDSWRRLEHGARRSRRQVHVHERHAGTVSRDGARGGSPARRSRRGGRRPRARPRHRTRRPRRPGQRNRCSGRRRTSRSTVRTSTIWRSALQPGMTMTGRVTFEGSSTPAADGSHARARQPRAARSTAGIRNGRRAAGAGRRDRALHDHGRCARTLHALGQLPPAGGGGGGRAGGAHRPAARKPPRSGS